METILNEQLANKQYDSNETSALSKDIATLIKSKLKDLKLPRYKYLVQVMIGEMRGAGVRCGCRCLWDQNTDKLAEVNFKNVETSINT